MKKIRNKVQYLRHQRRRAMSSLAARERQSETRLTRNLMRYGTAGRLDGYLPTVSDPRALRRRASITSDDPYRLDAPKTFSLAQNPDQIIPFFQTLLRRQKNNKPARVRFTNVVSVGQDAILLLMAAGERFAKSGVEFSGNFPIDREARRAFKRSGFFDGVHEGVFSQRTDNLLVTHGRTAVLSGLTAEITKWASESIWGKGYLAKGVQSVFVELMQNTHNHAELYREGAKEWWISASVDKRARVARFVFADFGVGVIRSLDSKKPGDKWWDVRDQAYRIFNDRNPAFYLKLILEGVQHQTSSGKSFRGKGLPCVKRIHDRGGISNLSIMTNNVHAQVTKGLYNTMGCSFQGTVISWEINADSIRTGGL